MKDHKSNVANDIDLIKVSFERSVTYVNFFSFSSKEKRFEEES